MGVVQSSPLPTFSSKEKRYVVDLCPCFGLPTYIPFSDSCSLCLGTSLLPAQSGLGQLWIRPLTPITEAKAQDPPSSSPSAGAVLAGVRPAGLRAHSFQSPRPGHPDQSVSSSAGQTPRCGGDCWVPQLSHHVGMHRDSTQSIRVLFK